MAAIRTAEELDALIAHLNVVKTDHQWIEAKRAQRDLPNSVWKTLSAFANSETGGTVLLGVTEQDGRFSVTGVENPAVALSSVQAICGEAQPPLRPIIATIEHPAGVVIAAEIGPVPPQKRPCHFPRHGTVHQTSFVRVGDADMPMTASEVEALLAAHSGEDYSARPTPGVQLNRTVAAAFAERVRLTHDDDEQRVLQRWGIVDTDERVSLAGALTLGDEPQLKLPSARVACLQMPRPADPAGTRQSGTHIEGTIGEIIDGTLRWFGSALTTHQIVKQGQVYDDLDYPAEALRELVANALVHRSLAPGQESTSVNIMVSGSVIAIASPGGLHHGLEVRDLGMTRASSPRNYRLVRICEHLRTPLGARVMESQSSGIAAADHACHLAGVAPPLFFVTPTRFTALCLRGALPVAEVVSEHPELERLGSGLIRLAAFAKQLETAQAEDAAGVLRAIPLDLWLAARVLAAGVPDAAMSLRQLTHMHILEASLPVVPVSSWSYRVEAEESFASTPTVDLVLYEDLPAIPRVSKRRQPAVRALLREIAGGGELQPRDIEIGLKPRALRGVIAAALEADLIEPTTTVEHDPTRAYRLTPHGRRHAPAKS
jgi:ATP-dependent DNA helicase RecG